MNAVFLRLLSSRVCRSGMVAKRFALQFIEPFFSFFLRFYLRKTTKIRGRIGWWLSRFVICCGKLFRGDFVEFNSIGFGNVNGGGI